MKVGVFVGEAPPDRGGGFTFVEEVLAELERRSQDSPHSFTVLTTAAAPAGGGGGGGGGDKLESVSLASALPRLTTRVRSKLARGADRLLGRPLARTSWANPAMDRLLAQARIDVVWHLLPAVALSLDVPYITVVWDLQHRLQPFFPEVSAGDEAAFRDNVYATVLPRASLVIAGTEVGRDEIVRFYGVAPERIRLLPHPTPGFALEAAEAAAGERPAIAPPDPYLFYPAQLWPHKNHANLLEALRLLRERDRVPFSLALSGADKGNLAFIKETAARLGVADAVRFLGFVSREDLVGLYRHAFALVYPTFFGPENLPTLEAFALGCPVIASDVSGAREQLADAALLFDPRKPAEIADAVKRLYGDPALRATLVARGKTRARRFTGRDFVSGVLAWLDDFGPVRRCWPGGGTTVE